jgi:glutamate-ammonia-ligase adenylyltransferase
MALTRARPTAGDPALGERVMAVIGETLRRPRDEGKLLADVADMRRRMAAQHPHVSFWEAKHRRGGIVDVEFIAQYLELRHAARHPEVIDANTVAALERLAAAGALDRPAADDLVAASRLWRRVQTLQKLLLPDLLDEEKAPATLKEILARGANEVDFAALKGAMTATAERVMRHYARLIDEPADALPRQSATPEEKKP